MKRSATDTDLAKEDEKAANESLRDSEISKHLQLIRSAEANLAAAKRWVNHNAGAGSYVIPAELLTLRRLH